jgi:hypothetical protein
MCTVLARDSSTRRADCTPRRSRVGQRQARIAALAEAAQHEPGLQLGRVAHLLVVDLQPRELLLLVAQRVAVREPTQVDDPRRRALAGDAGPRAAGQGGGEGRLGGADGAVVERAGLEARQADSAALAARPRPAA